MKQLVILSLIFIAASCTSEPKGEDSLEQKEMVQQIAFAQLEMSMPTSYGAIDIDNFSGLAIPAPIQAAFSDSSKSQHTIVFTEEEPTYLLQEAAEKKAKARVDELVAFYKKRGLKGEGFESKVLTTQNKKRIIKAKIMLIQNGEEIYLTQYIVGTRAQTISVYVINSTETDFERQVRNTVFR